MTDSTWANFRRPMQRAATRAANTRTLGTAVDAPAGGPPAGSLYHRRLRPRSALRDLWAVREVSLTLAERDIRVRYKQAALGLVWSLLTPLGLLVAFAVVFVRAGHVDTDGVPYPLFAYVALIPWTFFSATVANGASSLLSDKALLNKTYFPREVFPLNAAVVATFDAMTSLIPLAIIFGIEHRAPRVTALLVPLPLLVLLVFALGLSLLMSAVTVYFRDVRLGMPLLLQMGLFLTPVGYRFDVIPKRFRLLYSAVNPAGPVMDAVRNTLLLDRAPNWATLGVGAATALLTLAVGWIVFKRLETGFADVA